MTDKEQIIIDGVDVSGCEYVCNTAFGNIGCKLPFNEEIHCCNIPNCYYKQLKRKEQEINNIHEYYKELRINATELADKNIKLKGQLKEKEQVCKELKKQCNEHRSNAESYCKSYQYSCVVNGKITDKALKYKQALDEIAAHYQKVINNITTYDDSYDASISIEALHNISDIINKAKGNN